MCMIVAVVQTVQVMCQTFAGILTSGETFSSTSIHAGTIIYVHRHEYYIYSVTCTSALVLNMLHKINNTYLYDCVV